MKSYKFLVVDDATFMRRLLKEIIESNPHYTVVGEAATGIDAIEQARTLKPDVITLDITMPEMSGIDALKEVKRVSPGSKVIMVTAMGQQSIVIDAVKMGAVDFIVKPFEEDRVHSAISRVLE